VGDTPEDVELRDKIVYALALRDMDRAQVRPRAPPQTRTRTPGSTPKNFNTQNPNPAPRA